jgi:hypothetical protein
MVIVPVLALSAVMVVPGAMNVLWLGSVLETEIGCPMINPVKPVPPDTFVMTALPLVRVPVVLMLDTAVVTVAVFDMVTALPITETVVPDWTPEPVEVIGCPTISELALVTDVMLALPAVRRP